MNEPVATPEARLTPPEEVPLVRFTLRQMLLFVVGVSIVCMVLVSLQGYAAIVFGIGVLLISGHVLSTMIGSRLRAGADATREWELQKSCVTRPAAIARASRPDLAKPSQLQVRTSCGRLLWGFVGVAVVCGGLIGAGALKLLAGPDLNWPGQFIGALSIGLVFGWASLIVAGICGIARRSWHEVENVSKNSRP